MRVFLLFLGCSCLASWVVADAPAFSDDAAAQPPIDAARIDQGLLPAPTIWGTENDGYRLALKSVPLKVPEFEATGSDRFDKIMARYLAQGTSTNPRHVYFTLEVVGDTPRTFLGTDPYRANEYRITGPDGKPVEVSPAGKKFLESSPPIFSLSYIRITRGVAKQSVLDLGKLFDLNTPGKYEVVVSCKMPSTADPKKDVTVTSNTLTIEIKPDDVKKEK